MRGLAFFLNFSRRDLGKPGKYICGYCDEVKAQKTQKLQSPLLAQGLFCVTQKKYVSQKSQRVQKLFRLTAKF